MSDDQNTNGYISGDAKKIARSTARAETQTPQAHAPVKSVG